MADSLEQSDIGARRNSLSESRYRNQPPVSLAVPREPLSEAAQNILNRNRVEQHLILFYYTAI